MGAARVKNVDRMMTSVDPQRNGIEVTFADVHRGLVPITEIPEVNGGHNLDSIELPNPYEVVLRTSTHEKPKFPGTSFATAAAIPAGQERVSRRGGPTGGPLALASGG